MKKLVFLLCIVFAFPAIANEGDEEEPKGPWTYNGFFSQQLNQVSFSNWAAGGENNFASTSIFNLAADYKKDKSSWENKLETAYGIIKTADSPTRKSQDRIDFISKYGRSVSPKTALSALANFKSQFNKGYKYPNDSVVVSRFMAPGFLLASIGIDYKPLDYLSIFISPATGKFTFVTDPLLSEQGAFGVDPGKKVNPEFGAMASITFNKEVFTNVRLASKVDLFNNYTDSDQDNRKRVDVNWQTSVNMTINKFLSASAMLHMIYDYDIVSEVQLQQMFGIGLSYNF
jgi:hypothetical protein